MTDSNCRPPRCKRDALPTELIAHTLFISKILIEYIKQYLGHCKRNYASCQIKILQIS